MEIEDKLLKLGYKNILYMEEYPESIIGVYKNFALYDYNLLVQEICKQDGCEDIDAMEYIDYNIAKGLPYYPNHPIILYMTYDIEELEECEEKEIEYTDLEGNIKKLTVYESEGDWYYLDEQEN